MGLGLVLVLGRDWYWDWHWDLDWENPQSHGQSAPVAGSSVSPI